MFWKPRKKVFLEYGETQLCPGQLSTSLKVSQGHVLERVGSVYVLVTGNFMDKELISLGQHIAIFFDLSINTL